MNDEFSKVEDLISIIYEAQIQNAMKDFEETQISAEKAYQLSKDYNLPLYTIDSLLSLMISEMAFEDIDKVQEQLVECDSLLESISEENEDQKLERNANILKMRGIVNSILGNIESTIKYYTSALQMFVDLSYQFDVVELLNDLGESYRLFGNLDKALELFVEGFQMAKDINYEALLPYFANHLGQIYRVRGYLTQALTYYEQGLDYAEVLGHEKYFIVDYSAIGNIYWQQGDPEKALAFLHENFGKK